MRTVREKKDMYEENVFNMSLHPRTESTQYYKKKKRKMKKRKKRNERLFVIIVENGYMVLQSLANIGKQESANKFL